MAERAPERLRLRSLRSGAALAAALALVAVVLALLDEDPAMAAADYAAVALLFSLTGSAAIALAVRAQLAAARRERWRLVAGTVLRSMAASALWLVGYGAVVLALSGGEGPSDLGALWLLMWLLAQGVVGVRVALDEQARAHRAREQALQVAAAADRARLAALRHQLDPHFLFNSLTTIAALVHDAPAQAEAAIGQLAQLLRHSLSTGDAEGTVAHELEVVRALAALAKARFEDALVIELVVDGDDAALAAAPLPPFLMQPLVENAIAHGMRAAAPPVHIEVTVARGERGLHVEVVNDGTLEARVPDRVADGGGHSSVGLANLRARLELLYPGRHAFALEQRGGRVHARLRLDEEVNDAA